MYRLRFQKGDLKHFIQSAEDQLDLSLKEIAKRLNISTRTLRDWKREKFNPNSKAIDKLSKWSLISIPKHITLNRYWYVKKGARLGGIKTYELYGLLGNKETRAKGGWMSWIKRKNDPDLWKKYLNTFSKPQDSKELAEFIGIMLGDGGLTNRQITIYLSSITDQKYAEYVVNLIKKLFALKASIKEVQKYHVLRIGISGINVVKYLIGKGLKIGNKVHLQVGVPDWIWKKNDYIKACIRGLIDTDGCFVFHKYTVNGKKYKYPKLTFSNKSEPILDFVYQGLNKLGYHPKRTKAFEVWLYNQNEVKQYLQEIGTRNIKPTVKVILTGGVR